MDTYEKKYNEALKDMRAIYPNLKGDAKLAVEHAFPELRESEDEKVRTLLVALVQWAKTFNQSGLDPNTANEMLSYLEKQKEQKPVLSDEAIRDGVVHFGITQYQIDNWLKKHINIVEQKPAVKQDYSDLTDLERVIHRGFLSAGVENVPVGIIKETAKECITQMKPAEWSEEDERILKGIIGLVDHDQHYGVSNKEMLAWLKSLRPQPRPEVTDGEIEEMVTKRSRSSGTTKSEMAFYRNGIKDAIKRFGLRPSWKPSEKQMNCLCAAVDAAIRKHNESVSGYEPARVLKSLYEDLQKL